MREIVSFFIILSFLNYGFCKCVLLLAYLFWGVRKKTERENIFLGRKRISAGKEINGNSLIRLLSF